MKITLNPIKWFIIVLSLFLPPLLAANESWFCTEESGRKIGNVIQACGVGETLVTENIARANALENAIHEFKMICNISDDCRGHSYNVEPKRLSCGVDKATGFMKCYKLIEVTILE